MNERKSRDKKCKKLLLRHIKPEVKSCSTEGVKVTHEEIINGGESHKTFVPRIIKEVEIREKLDKIRENLSEENGKKVTLYHIETKSGEGSGKRYRH